MKRATGFTLIEMCMAIGLLAFALTSAWALIMSANRHQRELWDEFQAHEAAVSAVEAAAALKTPGLAPQACTPAPIDAANLIGPTVSLQVRNVNADGTMLEIEAVVEWTSAQTGQKRSETFKALRRNSP